MIIKTFRPFLPKNARLPSGLVPDLLTRFSTSEGYALCPDVLPLFSMLRQLKLQPPGHHDPHRWPWDRTLVGIITNSDDRIPGILSSFGLSVGPRRFGTVDTDTQDDSAREKEDVSFVILSYDVGASKPDRRIFDAAREMGAKLFAERGAAQRVGAEGFELLYVGDEMEKDVLAATDAGWNAVLVDRKGMFSERFGGNEGIVKVSYGDRDPAVIRDLSSLSSWRTA